jgi:hypothetical protein
MNQREIERLTRDLCIILVLGISLALGRCIHGGA